MPAERFSFPTAARSVDRLFRRLSIYVAVCGEYTKVGIAIDPDKRIKALSASVPWDVELVWSREGYDHLVRAVERYVHDRLAAMHHKSEWFSVEPEAAIEVCTRIMDTADATFERWLAEGRVERLFQKEEEVRRAHAAEMDEIHQRNAPGDVAYLVREYGVDLEALGLIPKTRKSDSG